MDNGRFQDRRDAGRQVATLLDPADYPNALVLALPRGGVPVAYEIAEALRAPLDVFLVRKLGLPGHEELAMGAIASGGVRVLNDDVIQLAGVTEAELEAITRLERAELERRAKCYRDERPPVDVAGRNVIVVDDGLATGATMRAAVAALRRLDARTITIAVPTASPETCVAMREIADRVICAVTPPLFWSVGAWYRDFAQVDDQEVAQLLKRGVPRAGLVSGTGSGTVGIKNALRS